MLRKLIHGEFNAPPNNGMNPTRHQRAFYQCGFVRAGYAGRWAAGWKYLF